MSLDPSNLNEVFERDKDIRYSSRTHICLNASRDKHDVRHAINELHKLLPADLANTDQAKGSMSTVASPRWILCILSIVQIRPKAPQRTMNSAVLRWRPGGRWEFPTVARPCVGRLG
jgi:hypothetical protein